MNVEDILRRCATVLFDFDGPLCDVFAGMPAPQVARRIEKLAGRQFDTDDPLEVLRLAAVQTPGRVNAVEDELIRAEVEAVTVSAPELAGVASLHTIAALGWKVGIVSNNSEDAVRRFLAEHGKAAKVPIVVGRPYRHPELMKPEPWPLTEATRILESEASKTVLIGDSFTDIQASTAAESLCIAFANKSNKIAPFTATGVTVINSMVEIEDAALRLRGGRS